MSAFAGFFYLSWWFCGQVSLTMLGLTSSWPLEVSGNISIMFCRTRIFAYSWKENFHFCDTCHFIQLTLDLSLWALLALKCQYWKASGSFIYVGKSVQGQTQSSPSSLGINRLKSWPVINFIEFVGARISPFELKLHYLIATWTNNSRPVMYLVDFACFCDDQFWDCLEDTF